MKNITLTDWFNMMSQSPYLSLVELMNYVACTVFGTVVSLSLWQ